jgi:hypothetical protein
MGTNKEMSLTQMKRLKELEARLPVIEERFKLLEKKQIDLKMSLYDLIRDADNLFVKDLTLRYGFTEDEMYYIGAASGRMFTAPTNKKILSLIQNINNLDWRGIQTINKYFMKTTKKQKK